MKRILVCCPTSIEKNYCFTQWLDNTMSFTYPNYHVVMFDNTSDNGENAKYLESIYEDRNYLHPFNAIPSNVKNIKSVINKMAISHDDCRRYAIINNYDYILHLESDVFPEPNIIEELLIHDKKVIGAVYDRDEGSARKPMIQTLNIFQNRVSSFNLHANESFYFLDGTLKKVASVGLGCVLISRKVFEKIPFRFEPNRNAHPDTFFSEDCLRFGIPIFCNTKMVCRHDNKPWGLYGKDFK